MSSSHLGFLGGQGPSGSLPRGGSLKPSLGLGLLPYFVGRE